MRFQTASSAIETGPDSSGLPGTVAVLIEVPAITVSTRRFQRTDRASGRRRAPSARLRAAVIERSGRQRIPGRRRLRREVRLAGRIVLGIAAALVSGFLMRGGTGSGQLRSGMIPSVDLGAAISTPELEPVIENREVGVPRVAASTGVGPRPRKSKKVRPVVFPGYLLPDDAVEAPGHGGS